MFFYGVLAVGTQGGHVYLLDLALDGGAADEEEADMWGDAADRGKFHFLGGGGVGKGVFEMNLISFSFRGPLLLLREQTLLPAHHRPSPPPPGAPVDIILGAAAATAAAAVAGGPAAGVPAARAAPCGGAQQGSQARKFHRLE